MPIPDFVVGGMLALRDSKLSRFSMPEILDLVKAARDEAGMNLLTLWPHYEKAANDEVLNLCRKLGVEVHLWYPILADNDIVPDLAEMTENAWGKRGRGEHGVWADYDDSDDTYAFACPRRQSMYNRLCLARYKKLLPDYDGAILENVRYPTPSNGIESVFSCFCQVCRAQEPRTEEWRRQVLELRTAFESATDRDLEKWGTLEGMFRAFSLDKLFRSREDVIYELAARYAAETRKEDKKFALALVSPALTLLAGQDYPRLTSLADWVRPLILCRARCPSGFRTEIPSMLRGMMAWNPGFTVPAIMHFLSRSTGLQLPSDFYAVSESGLPAETSFGEVAAAGQMAHCPVYPCFEFMRENPDYQMETDEKDVAAYLEAAAQSPGFFMAWNLLFYPPDFLAMVKKRLRK